MKKVYLFIYILILSIATGCGNDDERLNLRSDINESFYWDNNKAAAQRLAKIMYRETGNQTQERFKIVHFSDPHLSSWSSSNNYKRPINLRQTIRFANQKELRINAIVATGDYISIEKKSKAEEFMRSFIYNLYQENQVPTFICTGNHDSNTEEELSQKTFLNKREVNAILFSQNNYSKQRKSTENYYYSDVENPQGGVIRIIALDMLDQPASEYNTLYYAHFSQKQIDWLTNTALKEGMTQEHSVIVLTHFPFQRHGTGYLCDADFVHPWSMIPEIIEAFRSRTALNKTYPSKLDSKTIQVKADFRDTQGEFICYLGGHIHSNANFEITDLENRDEQLSPQKMILCTNQAPSEIGTVYNRVKREEDSLSSNSFCIYTIDTQEKKIYMTFFGAYQPSNEPNYPEIHVIPY